MQDLQLGNGETLRKGSLVTGHVLQASNAGKESDQALLSFQFDQVRFADREINVTTFLRALPTSPDYADDLVQIGGKEVFYGQGGPVMVGAEVVGESTCRGVVAHFINDFESECHGGMYDNTRPQAFWLFAANACGAYGFDGVKIIHSGFSDPVSQATVASNRTVEISSGSGMLLRVEALINKSVSSIVQCQTLVTLCGSTRHEEPQYLAGRTTKKR